MVLFFLDALSGVLFLIEMLVSLVIKPTLAVMHWYKARRRRGAYSWPPQR